MNRSAFNTLIDCEFDVIKGLNETKGNDYAGHEDVLANFKRQAQNLGLTKEQVLAVYLNKHFDAINTYCKDGSVKSEPIEGRIHDAIVYLLLLRAMIAEPSR